MVIYNNVNEKPVNVVINNFGNGDFNKRASLYIDDIKLPCVQSYDIHFDVNSKISEITIKMFANVTINNLSDDV